MRIGDLMEPGVIVTVVDQERGDVTSGTVDMISRTGMAVVQDDVLLVWFGWAHLKKNCKILMEKSVA